MRRVLMLLILLAPLFSSCSSQTPGTKPESDRLRQEMLWLPGVDAAVFEATTSPSGNRALSYIVMKPTASDGQIKQAALGYREAQWSSEFFVHTDESLHLGSKKYSPDWEMSGRDSESIDAGVAVDMWLDARRALGDDVRVTIWGHALVEVPLPARHSGAVAKAYEAAKGLEDEPDATST